MRQQFEYTHRINIPRFVLLDTPGYLHDASRAMSERFQWWLDGRHVDHWWVEPTFDERVDVLHDIVRIRLQAAGWFEQDVPPGTRCLVVNA